MHYLGFGARGYPPIPFGSARIWDMGVTWKDLQPTPASSLTGSGSAALQRLDAIVTTFKAHHVEPLLTLGMTPDWAARNCRHVIAGMDWGSKTCAPRDTTASGPWGRYVRAMATRYRGSVRYFELWNEPSLRNGWNDALARLARMQSTAHRILRGLGFGQQLVAPSIAFTDGAPRHGLRWLDTFLSLPGGTDFDIVGLHLYPSDPAARRGVGPEWVVETALPAARTVLAQHGLAARPVWDTETNVGRVPAGITFSGTRAAGLVARTFLLATENDVRRTFWYAADDRYWGGIWLENPDYASLTTAGDGYQTARARMLGQLALGCDSVKVGSGGERYTCRFGQATGRVTLLALWTTASPYSLRLPTGTLAWYSVDGQRHRASGRVTVSAAPVYLTGAFH
jgi:hypothetical protein